MANFTCGVLPLHPYKSDCHQNLIATKPYTVLLVKTIALLCFIQLQSGLKDLSQTYYIEYIL